MTTQLQSKPGITGATVRSIPQEWDPAWFRGFINNMLKGADVRNAVGINGITVSGNIASPYATISGSGLGSPSNVTPDTHVSGVQPSAQNDEFEYGSSLDTVGARFVGATPWTWINQETATASVAQGGLFLTPAQNTGHYNIISQPIVGSTWAYTTRFMANMLAVGGIFGIVAIESSTQKSVALGLYNSGGAPPMNLLLYSAVGYAPQANTGLLTTETCMGSFPHYTDQISTAESTPQYFRLSGSGGILHIYYSYSGYEPEYYNITNISYGTYFTTAPDTIGVFGQGVPGATQCRMHVDWFRKTA